MQTDFGSGNPTIALSAAGGNQLFTVTVGVDKNGNGALDASEVQRTINVSLLGAPDLEVDSNNDGQITAADNSNKDARGASGVVLIVNSFDGDDDGIPDFADGYNRDTSTGSAPSGYYLASTADNQAPDQYFYPIGVTLPAGINLSTAKIRFIYSDSNPLAVTGDGTPENPFTPAPGILRLWDVSPDQRSTGRSVADGGDFVESGGSYTPSQLGFTASSKTLYLEAVNATTEGPQEISIELDPGGAVDPGYVLTDKVKFSTAKLDASLGVPTSDPSSYNASITIKIQREGDTSLPIDLNYSLDGSPAVYGIDYTGGGAEVGGGVFKFTIPSGSVFSKIIFTPLTNAFSEGDGIYFSILGAGKPLEQFLPPPLKKGAVLIKQQSGKVTQVDSTTSGFQAALQAAANSGDLITELTITGHGSPGEIDLNETQWITTQGNPKNPSILITDVKNNTNVDISTLLSKALADHAIVELQGCNTAWGKNSFAQQVSAALPGRIVIGSWLPAARIWKNTVSMWKVTFLNGKEQ